MPLPPDLYDENVNYRIRLCILIEENPTLGLANGSKVHQCARCEKPIWVDENQELPEADVHIDGDIEVCYACLLVIQQEDGTEPIWLGPSPKDIGLM